MYTTRIALAASLILFSARGAEDNVKQFSVVIDKPELEYTVDVGGTAAPENLEIVIENLGEAPVVNPRLSANGLYDWYDTKSLVEEITRGLRTDEEKAIAIWAWIRYRTFQRSPQDPSAVHPVRAMNGYGYGICGHVAHWMKCLWTAAGLKARVQELWGHTVSEAYYDSAWHMLDGNVKVFYLDRDNRTIASLATLERNASLIERAIHPREFEPWFLGPDPPGRNEDFVRYLVSYKDNYEEHSFDAEIAKEYSMAMTLRPGEKLVRWWTPKLRKFEGRTTRAYAPEQYANGQLIWEPDLAKIDIGPYLSTATHGNIATRAQDGKEPAIHVADLQDELYTRPATFSIPMESPYPIMGGRMTCTLLKGGESGLDSVSVYFGQPRWESGDLYEYRWGHGPRMVELDLDSRILKSGEMYKYSVGFAVRGNAASKPPSQAGVQAFRFETDLQVAPQSLPALRLGKNTIRFRQQAPARVKVTHRWKESREPGPPGAAKAAVEPADGAEAATLAPVLRWSPVAGAADYQVMVSLRPECRWPLSTTLHQNVGTAKTEWKVPSGFLNPGTTYYWKVLARDGRGMIGEWGPVFRFSTAANAR